MHVGMTMIMIMMIIDMTKMLKKATFKNNGNFFDGTKLLFSLIMYSLLPNFQHLSNLLTKILYLRMGLEAKKIIIGQ